MEQGIEFERAKFVSDPAQLEEMGERAKLRRCPHCQMIGTMNSHGFLRGNSIFGGSGMIRGRRFFCSNRGYRPGCGRTVSILLQTMIHTFTVITALLVSFVSGILAGTSVRAAWLAASAGTMSERSDIDCGNVSGKRWGIFARNSFAANCRHKAGPPSPSDKLWSISRSAYQGLGSTLWPPFNCIFNAEYSLDNPVRQTLRQQQNDRQQQTSLSRSHVQSYSHDLFQSTQESLQ